MGYVNFMGNPDLHSEMQIYFKKFTYLYPSIYFQCIFFVGGNLKHFSHIVEGVHSMQVTL